MLLECALWTSPGWTIHGKCHSWSLAEGIPLRGRQPRIYTIAHGTNDTSRADDHMSSSTGCESKWYVGVVGAPRERFSTVATLDFSVLAPLLMLREFVTSNQFVAPNVGARDPGVPALHCFMLRPCFIHDHLITTLVLSFCNRFYVVDAFKLDFRKDLFQNKRHLWSDDGRLVFEELHHVVIEHAERVFTVVVSWISSAARAHLFKGWLVEPINGYYNVTILWCTFDRTVLHIGHN
jgi:hypothetical protein